MHWQGKLIFALIIVISAAWAGFTYMQLRFNRPGPLQEATTIIFPSGASSRTIANTLLGKGVIESPLEFRIAVRTGFNDRMMKAGEYRFEPRVSIREIMKKMTGGDVIHRAITIPEGWTFAEIKTLVMNTDGLVGPALDFAEGALLPNTYHFEYGTRRTDLMRTMAKAMNEAVEQAWANRNPNIPLNSPEELLILASIVEKETGIADERGQVAGVFINRLQKNMRLQSDPTVIYGASNYSGNITRKHLREDHPYNTYVHRGLPPTPIASPGVESLQAVANPIETEYLFFVTDGKGGHVFSKSYDEHRKHVNAMLSRLKNQ